MTIAMRVIGDQFRDTGGRPTGFDYLRIVLAVSIIVWHTIYVCFGLAGEAWFWTGPLRPIIMLIIPSFFALSGFLVAGSLVRNKISSFLTLRVIRIGPALFCEVVISAFIIGPLLTDLPLHDYFVSRQFSYYFGNIIGNIHYHLPGVFQHNPATEVNVQLWTIPFELRCYIAITILAVFGVVNRIGMFSLIVGLSILAAFLQIVVWARVPPLISPVSGNGCVLAFLAGVLLFLGRDRIPYTRFLCALALACSWGLLSFASTSYLAVVPVAYLTVWIGLQNPSKIFLIAGADYSYGIYLYGFPIQQAVYQLGGRAWYLNLSTSLILAFAAAYLSWTLVESRVLARRKAILSRVDSLIGAVSLRAKRT